MDILRIPRKVYFKSGCTPVALREMQEVYGLQNAFLITNSELYRKGVLGPVEKRLQSSGLHTAEFFTLLETPTIENIKSGLLKMDEFSPDVIIGVGDEAILSAAKLMWLLYENPDADIAALAAGAPFPAMGKKAKLVLMSTTCGSGCECSPYAGIVDEKTGKKIWLANYDLVPEMAVIDPARMTQLSATQIKQGGLQVLKNAIGSAVAANTNVFSIGYARDAARNVFVNLEKAMAGVAKEPVACEALANAAANAGMAYSCAAYDAPPLDADTSIEALISSAADKSWLVDLAKDCGLGGANDDASLKNLVAECKRVAAL